MLNWANANSETDLRGNDRTLGPHSGEIPTARSQSDIFPISIHLSSDRRLGSLKIGGKPHSQQSCLWAEWQTSDKGAAAR